MTLIKEKAVEMIQRMPDDNMLYVVNILRNLEEMSANKKKDKREAEEAFQNILTMERRLPENFDMEREFQEAMEEKYGNFS